MSESESNAPKSQKPKRRRLLLKIGILAVLLLVGLVITVGLVAKSFVTPDFIVAKMEAENNCRVQIQKTSVNLLSFPARIKIEGIKIAKRDEYADSGTKLADRPRLEGVGVINADSITLEANLFNILRKKISLKDLTVKNLYVSQFLIEREGGNSLDPLFDPPVTVSGSANPEFEEKKMRRDKAKERRKMTPEQREEIGDQPFAISELPLPATMDTFEISDAQINAKIRKNKTRITFSKVQLKVSEIDLDPSDLENHNSAKVNISGHLDIEDRDRTVKYADLDIQSEGDVTPFDPVTGYVNPDLTYKITVLEGGKLEAVPSLVKLASKIKKFREYGLKLDALAEDITLDADTVLTLGYRDHSIRIVDDVTIQWNGHRLVVKKGGWLHTGENQHEAEAVIFLSKAASDKALGEAHEFLKEKGDDLGLGEDRIQAIATALLGPITKDGHIWVPFESKGDFNDPDVEPTIDLKSLGEAVAMEALGQLLDEAQKKAGENGEEEEE